MSTTALPPDLSRLLAFVRVVEAGSFAEAARRAGTTTSAMSKAVARLEQARGMRLLHRSTHSLALTEEGDRLMRRDARWPKVSPVSNPRSAKPRATMADGCA
jgi:DNA-binding MarR family transcriptional regulator